MFIIKAEVRSDVGPQNYSLFSARRVAVSKSTLASCGSPGHPCPPDPELEVRLFDEQDNCREVLNVGHGLDHYSAVYIMNEKGKTVDSVYPGPAPANIPSNTTMMTYSDSNGTVRVARVA